MLFVTNCRVAGARRSEAGRKLSFAHGDPEPGASLYFCQRLGPDQYVELTAAPFFGRLRRSPRRQVLFFVHGFSCQPEARVFPDALQLQALCDALDPDLVEVVAVVWPCDDDFGLLLDYWDDQHSATVSGYALARMIGKFAAWRDRLGTEDTCLKHVNVLAHSMGNRVLATALASWAHDYGVVPAMFRSLFLAAADVANDLFEPERPGAVLSDSARHVVVYHAADDFALRTSKIVNLKNRIVRRRLGHTGPADPARVPANVVAVDCDDFNNLYDPLGHSYLLADPDGRPGMALQHMVQTMRTGRVGGAAEGQRRIILGRQGSPEQLAANSNLAQVAPAPLSA